LNFGKYVVQYDYIFVLKSMANSKKLRRSLNDRKLAGVAGGLGAYFSIDPVVFRILFVILLFFKGFGILVYVILWVVLPADSADSEEKDDKPKPRIFVVDENGNTKET
jgi:phage shock protein C